MKNTFGSSVCLTIFGESHGPAIGAVLDGLCAGLPVDEAFIARQMDKRRARGDGLSTGRTEADRVHLLSGVLNGRTTGTAIALLIENKAQRSGDYAKTQDLLRPGHADFTAYAKYGGWQDSRGGGHFSGRITAPLVAAGAICQQVLAARGITIATHIQAAAGVEAMRSAIRAAGAEGDSVGGILETAVLGLPAGVGEPFFDSVESVLSHLLFSIPAVKGVEFGLGFGFAGLRGSQANDPFRMEEGRVVTATNHNGGVNGGIANGMPLVFRTAVKPTPSIYKPQQTVDYVAKRDAELQIQGRHDPCIVHRAAVVQTCAAALGLLDLLTTCEGTRSQKEN